MDTLRNEISAVTAVALIAGICRIVRRPILVCVVAGGNAVIAVVVIDLGCNLSGGNHHALNSSLRIFCTISVNIIIRPQLVLVDIDIIVELVKAG